MTLYYINTDEPHWVPSDGEEHVYQALGLRVTYIPVGEYEWARRFLPWNEDGENLLEQVLEAGVEASIGFLFPEGPEPPEIGQTFTSSYTPSSSRMDLSKTNVTLDSSAVTIDQITV